MDSAGTFIKSRYVQNPYALNRTCPELKLLLIFSLNLVEKHHKDV